MDRNAERSAKLSRLRQLMTEEHVDALWLRRMSSFAWLTAGASSYVNLADANGVASLLVTRDRVVIATNNIEAPRLLGEEELVDCGFEWSIAPWYESADILRSLRPGTVVGCDEASPTTVNLSGHVSALRSRLLPVETERVRALGRLAAGAMSAAIQRVQPGLSELEIAGILSQEAYGRGLLALVNLVAVDERVFQFRHPIPTAKTLERYAMLVLTARKRGLWVALSRLAYFGRLPDDLKAKAVAAATVDATYISHTRPGKRISEVFEAGAATYTTVGFRDEWVHHHQGGSIGYEGREEKGRPASLGIVYEGQAYAWNPSIAGVKSEDTLIVGPTENEIVTATPELPTLEVAIGDQMWIRPAIWQR
jgi:Xaa-Pro aminopeptidase